MSSDFKNKVVLLVGAGSGIGRCLANEFAKHDAKLILTDLKLSALEETVANYNISDNVLGLIEHNLLDENVVKETLEKAFVLSPDIDVYYHNAGMMVMGQALKLTPDDFYRMQTVNLNRPIQFTQELLSTMKQKGGAYIAYTCSSSATSTPPGAAAYGMSKAGLWAYSEALRAEMRRHNVFVTTICPGFVHTPLMQNADYKDQSIADKTADVPSFFGSSPEKVARVAVKSMLKKKGMVVIGFDEKIKILLKYLFPRIYEVLQRLMAKMLISE